VTLGARFALQLLALTFTRPGELRLATWKEFDLDAGVWTIPANRMKMRRPHRIPLASQTISVLEELRTLTGQFELLFPGVRSPSRPLSENTLNAALRRLGYAQDDSHGFRAAASSLLNECGKWNADAIEAQLAHVESNAARKAYARAEYWAERVEMMAYWADRLDELRRGGIVVPLRA
jgi:integrase